jgi:hypothetical protein
MVTVAKTENQTTKTEKDYCLLYRKANKSVNKEHCLVLMKIIRFKTVTIVTK